MGLLMSDEYNYIDNEKLDVAVEREEEDNGKKIKIIKIVFCVLCVKVVCQSDVTNSLRWEENLRIIAGHDVVSAKT